MVSGSSDRSRPKKNDDRSDLIPTAIKWQTFFCDLESQCWSNCVDMNKTQQYMDSMIGLPGPTSYLYHVIFYDPTIPSREIGTNLINWHEMKERRSGKWCCLSLTLLLRQRGACPFAACHNNDESRRSGIDDLFEAMVRYGGMQVSAHRLHEC